MNKILDFVKQNVKISLTVAAFGVAVVAGLGAKGCDVQVQPETPPAVVAPVAP